MEELRIVFQLANPFDTPLIIKSSDFPELNNVSLFPHAALQGALNIPRGLKPYSAVMQDGNKRFLMLDLVDQDF